MEILFLVSCEKGQDLGVYRVKDADKKAVGQYCKELNSGSKKLRTNKDVNHNKQGITLALFPTLYFRYYLFSVIELILYSIGYLTCAAGISAKPIGVIGGLKHRFQKMRLAHV